MENPEIIELETDFPSDISSIKPMGFNWAQIEHITIGPKGVIMTPKGSKYPSPYEYPAPKKTEENIEMEKKNREEKKILEDSLEELRKENEKLKGQLEVSQKELNDFRQTVENAEKEKILSEVQEKAKNFGITLEEKIKDYNIEKLRTISETISKIPTTTEKDFGKGEVITSTEIKEDQLLKMAGL